jgi:hypothetical protein
VRLLATHVPDRYRRGIRYFGILASRAKNQHYAILFLLLRQQRRLRPKRLGWRDSLLKYFEIDPLVDSRGANALGSSREARGCIVGSSPVIPERQLLGEVVWRPVHGLGHSRSAGLQTNQACYERQAEFCHQESSLRARAREARGHSSSGN